MEIVNLSSDEYRTYSNIHSKRNFGQTIEYSSLIFNRKKTPLLLGLVDSNRDIQAAALILVNNVSPGFYEAVAPDGFLIDYEDFELVKTFTELLKKYLLKKGITYLITNPMFKNRVYNKNNFVIENNDDVLNNLYRSGYKSIGYFSEFERYDVIITDKNSTSEIYNGFNRNTKRCIKEALNYGVSLHKGKAEDLEQAYEMFKTKTKNDIVYYKNLMHIYNTEDNKMEIFFAKLNPHIYLVNVKAAYEKECVHNEKMQALFNKHVGNMSEKILNKKLSSDSRLAKLKQQLNDATILSQEFAEDIVIGTTVVIKNNHEIYFLIDGYLDRFKNIHTTHILKWAIIKKYFSLGYRIFNLGEIHNMYFDKTSKYHGQYMYKTGFGGNIIEYPPNLILLVNKPMYKLYVKLFPKKRLY